MSSSESSTVSPSPPASPRILQYGHPNLERLVQHFVSAKRALASSQHVEHATHLVADSRQLIEQTAVAEARNTYVRNKIVQQVALLHAVYDNISAPGIVVGDEFDAVIARLDSANDRLQSTMRALRKIVVDSSLQRYADDETDTEPTEQKTLFDFVDESQYEQISITVKSSIDAFNDAKKDTEQSLRRFDDAINAVQNLSQDPVRPESPTIKPSIYDDPLLPVAEAFDNMEEHASEMANLLQSLISHYDLCASALKHTEGGREAAKEAVLAVADGEIHASNVMDDSLFAAKIVDPISDEERAQMLEVLEGDVHEVEEVVIDIRERGVDIERLHQQFVRRNAASAASSRSVKKAVTQLHEIRQALPTYVEIVVQFQATWTDIQTTIDSNLNEITQLRAFYDEFVVGYKKLLREVDRRKAVQLQMEKLALKAQKELEQLYKADKLSRDEFVEDVASFLPSDLWPGVAEPAVHWKVIQTAPSAIDLVRPEMHEDEGQSSS